MLHVNKPEVEASIETKSADILDVSDLRDSLAPKLEMLDRADKIIDDIEDNFGHTMNFGGVSWSNSYGDKSVVIKFYSNESNIPIETLVKKIDSKATFHYGAKRQNGTEMNIVITVF